MIYKSEIITRFDSLYSQFKEINSRIIWKNHISTIVKENLRF